VKRKTRQALDHAAMNAGTSAVIGVGADYADTNGHWSLPTVFQTIL
jgi:hypothetical protein